LCGSEVLRSDHLCGSMLREGLPRALPSRSLLPPEVLRSDLLRPGLLRSEGLRSEVLPTGLLCGS
jgi:hypothetical protein